MIKIKELTYNDVLLVPTPDIWVVQALNNLDVLLIDHAHCEKKAASTALSLMYRYPEHPALLHKLSRLAREELRHFEQVLSIMQERDIRYRHLSPSRYAASLRDALRTHEPERLLDTLLVGALIEARSCERFACLIPHLPEELARFYQRLVRSEARHFQDYLQLATELTGLDYAARLEELKTLEAKLISTPDEHLRFHSGPMAADLCTA